MKKSVRDAREKLYQDSIKLRSLASSISGDKSYEIRDKQDELYKKWIFYNGIIKASDKIK